MVVFFGCMFIFQNDVIKSNGQVAGLWEMGTMASTVAIVIVNLRMAMETK